MASSLSSNLPWERASSLWSSALNPFISNSLNNVQILHNIVLKNGSNTFNHGLGKMQQGWFLVDIQGSANIYRSSSFTTTTLTLTSSAAVTVSIGVF